ncbi:MAG: serine hydrolase [Solirubrobacterales bacterium]
MKKLTAFLITLIMLVSSIPVTAMASSAPTVSADSAVLMDGATGKILYSKNMNTAYPPASTTKIMTALLTLEKCKLDDVVTVGKKPPLADGSKIYIFEGEQLKVKDLLYAMLLCSANDCAEALAEHIGGSVDQFVVLMNNRAKELGCKNTNFVNPSGLYDENHKTSAYDLALIMQELSKHKEYTEIATTLAYKIQPTNKSTKERPIWNENKLIQKYSQDYYPYCIGSKTGYTVQSMHSYVSAADKDGHKLIVALVHDTQKTFFPDAIALFNYGYNNYEYVKMFSKGDVVKTYNEKNTNVPLLASSDFYYLKEKGSSPELKVQLAENNLSVKYFSIGDIVDSADIYVGGEKVGKLDLQSGVNHKIDKIIASNYLLSGIILVLFLGTFVLVLIKIRKKKIKS